MGEQDLLLTFEQSTTLKTCTQSKQSSMITFHKYFLFFLGFFLAFTTVSYYKPSLTFSSSAVVKYWKNSMQFRVFAQSHPVLPESDS